MACYSPLRAFRDKDGGVVFVERLRHDVRETLWLSCGQCVGCRLERSRQWAVRCLHEAQLWKQNCFITCTYADSELLANGSLVYRHFQLFMKRLRKELNGRRVRFFMCGEYGEETHRPHYHACLFGFDFPDKVYYKKGEKDTKLYKSAMADRIWKHGMVTIGEVTFESAAYVARYVMKKATGDHDSVYDVIDLESGEVVRWEPEFVRMSLKRGIAMDWYKMFMPDVYPHGMVVVRGKEARPPKYYDRMYAKEFPDAYAELALAREDFAKERVADSTPERLLHRKMVTEGRLALSARRGVK